MRCPHHIVVHTTSFYTRFSNNYGWLSRNGAFEEPTKTVARFDGINFNSNKLYGSTSLGFTNTDGSMVVVVLITDRAPL